MLSKHFIIKAWVAVMAVLMLPLSVYADDGGKESGVTATLLLGLSQTHYGANQYHDSEFKVGFMFTPCVGYRFNDRWEAGALFKYEKVADAATYYGFGAYGEYNYLRFVDNRLRLFVDLQAYYSAGGRDGYGDDLGAPEDKQPTEVGFVPGIAYRIPGSKVDLKLRYLFIGFNNNDRWYKEMGGCVGRGDWILDAGLRRLEFGVAVNF